MGKVALKWGGVSGGIMTLLLIISYLLFPQNDPAYFSEAETYGYAAMVISLAVIYLAMAEYEAQAEAPVTLWQRILLGTLASLVAGAIFGLYNVVYSVWLNPEFLDSYYNYYISQLPEQSGPAFEAAVAELEAQKAMFMSPITQFLVMGATVVVIGIPMSIGLALVRKLREKAAS